MLEKIDLTKSLSKREYKSVFEPLQFRLGALQRQAHDEGIPIVVVCAGAKASSICRAHWSIWRLTAYR